MHLKIPRVVSNSKVQTFERRSLSNRYSFPMKNNFPEGTCPLPPTIGVDKAAREIPRAVGIKPPKSLLSSIKNPLAERWAAKASRISR